MNKRKSITLVLEKRAGSCRQLGSELHATIAKSAAENVVSGGIVAELLAPYVSDPLESALALRLLAAAHRVALRRDAPSFAGIYPSSGGSGNKPEAWAAFLGTVIEHFDELKISTGLHIQTNEVSRSAAFLGGFLLVAERTKLPLRVFEIGASAGLNLRWDRFRYVADDWQWGSAEAHLVLRNNFDAVPPRSRVMYRLSSGVDAIHPQSIRPRNRADGCSSRLSGPINSSGSTCSSEHAKSQQKHPSWSIAPMPFPGSSRSQLAQSREPATIVFHSVVTQYLT